MFYLLASVTTVSLLRRLALCAIIDVIAETDRFRVSVSSIATMMSPGHTWPSKGDPGFTLCTTGPSIEQGTSAEVMDKTGSDSTDTMGEQEDETKRETKERKIRARV